MRHKWKSTVISEIVMSAVAVAVFVGFMSMTLTAQKDKENQKAKKSVTYNKLTPEEEFVIISKGTEPPGSGTYLNNKEAGTYTCKRCDAKLYSSADKFDSHCGWPSFDDEISGAVTRTTDADGRRTEITCTNCGGHLGHIFEGEHLTDKNIRHCVNSISLNFEPVAAAVKTETAYFAGGCFWGVEHLFSQADGVKSVRSGYIGGKTNNPTYKEVCYTNSGHAEAVEILFDPSVTSFETMARLFFEIHDPTQKDRQGPDIGSQYRSEIFYIDDNQKAVSIKLISILRDKGFDVATELTKADKFWVAEDYHQDYYNNNGKEPYCHVYTKRF